MNDRYELVLSARLEESMLHVREWNINSESLGGDIGDSILVNFEISDSLTSLKVWLDDNILKGFLSSLNHLKLLHDVFGILLLILLLVHNFGLLDEVFNLFLGQSQVVALTSLIFVFESQLFDENSIWVSVVWEQKCS